MAASVSDLLVVLSRTLLTVVVLILMLEVASSVIVENLVDVFVGVDVVFVVVSSMITIMKTSEITMTCFASTIMISTFVTERVSGGDH